MNKQIIEQRPMKEQVINLSPLGSYRFIEDNQTNGVPIM